VPECRQLHGSVSAQRPEILLQRRAQSEYAYRPPRQNGYGPVAAAQRAQHRSEPFAVAASSNFLLGRTSPDENVTLVESAAGPGFKNSACVMSTRSARRRIAMPRNAPMSGEGP